MENQLQKKIQIKACLGKLASLKEQLLGKTLSIGHLDAKAKCSRRKKYDTVNFLWINIVLTALGFVHIREKRNHLAYLRGNNDDTVLLNFYELLGISGFSTALPSIGFFSDYVKYFNASELEDIQNRALRAIDFIKSEFNLLSIDGKDIRNCNGANVKSVNVVVNHALHSSYVVDSEQRWIKNKLTDVIDVIFKSTPNLVFTGDGIYHNTRIRDFFAKKGYLAILPMKNLTRLYRRRLNSLTGIRINQNRHVVFEHSFKRNGAVVHEIVQIGRAHV